MVYSNNTFSSAWKLKRIKNGVGVVKREREKPPVQSLCQLGAAQDTDMVYIVIPLVKRLGLSNQAEQLRDNKEVAKKVRF